jgi:hypothetical protein
LRRDGVTKVVRVGRLNKKRRVPKACQWVGQRCLYVAVWHLADMMPILRMSVSRAKADMPDPLTNVG